MNKVSFFSLPLPEISGKRPVCRNYSVNRQRDKFLRRRFYIFLAGCDDPDDVKLNNLRHLCRLRLKNLS